ncbi:MAG: gamma-glutamyltransferase, partial [Euzebyales bacterium]|nr:gamma-glutamyltransferase [Euzebyales bacterium]
LPLPDVLGYAIGYAERGFEVPPRLAATVEGVAELFRAEWTSSAQVWLPAGAPPRAGQRMTNPLLAATYRRLLAEAAAGGAGRDAQLSAARDAWSDGFVAEAIAGFVADAEVLDTSGRRHRGLLSGDDLAGWRAPLEAPVSTRYRDWTVHKTGPWGQGPVFCQQLRLLEGFDLAAAGHGSADWIHTIIECAKLAFADREAFYGDPAFVDVPLHALLDEGYAAERRRLVGERASLELRPGRPGGAEPRLPPSVQAGIAATLVPGTGEPTVAADPSEGDTCHVDVADRWGNVVAATPSGGWLQSSPAIPGLGFCLTTRAQMFWLDERHPNGLAGGKRPRTTLTPTLARHDGGDLLAFGTPGGDTQDQWSLALFCAHVDTGLGLQEAIEAPGWSISHFPSSFYPRRREPGRVTVEGRLDAGTLAALRRRGHDVAVGGDWTQGRLCAVGRSPDGTLKAAADPRAAQGYAAGR